MALHGLIEVNRQPIGEWSAVRIEGKEGGMCTYQCEVTQGSFTHAFKVQHHYDDGAIRLASKVLNQADRWWGKEVGKQG